MAARARRDELIALLVLIVLAGLITAAIAVIEPDNPLTGSAPEPSTPAPTSPDAPTETVMVGEDPFVYACRLVTKDDAAAAFGTFGDQGYVRQQYLVRTPTQAEFTGASTFSYGGLSTACTYWFDDPEAHALRLVVTQFPSDKPAERRWSRLRRDTEPVADADGRVRYLAEDRAFVIRSDRVLVEARYTVDDGRKRTRQPTRGEVTQRMLALAAAVDEHLADGSATSGPRPTNDGDIVSLGGTAYVEPCAVLDGASFAALGGPPAEPLVVDTSLIGDDPWTGAAVSSCERSGAVAVKRPSQERRTFAVLEIRYTADQAAAEEVRRRHLDNRYPAKAEITKLDTPDGTVAVVEPTGSKKAMRTRIAHVVEGPYELRLAVVRDVGPRHPTGVRVTDAQLLAAVAALREAVTKQEDGVS